MDTDKYIKKVSIIDYYITQNICDIISKPKEVDFIKNNLYLLAINNKQGNNSFNILINNKKFDFIKKIINYDKSVLKFCNSYEYNLFQSLIFYEKMYNVINNILDNSNIDFLTEIILKKNFENTNFIDLCIELININNELKKMNIINILIKIYKIFSPDSEKKLFIITKLCKIINNDKNLFTILEKFNIQNIDIYSDEYYNTCIDYLIEFKLFNSLSFIIKKINFIHFDNYDNNSLYNLIDEYPNMLNIIFEIMNKCDFNLLKNKKDENILYKLIQTYDIDKCVIKKYIDKFNIFEQNIDGDNLYNLLLRKFGKEIKDILTKQYNVDSQLNIKNTYDININIIDSKFNIKDLLVKTNNSSFNSNTLNYVIYLLICLKKYNFDMPYYSNKSDKYLLEQSNNNINMLKLYYQYYNDFNGLLPHIVIWENINNYFIHEKLVELIQKSNMQFVYVKLTLLIQLPKNTFIRHANLILVDKKNKVVERFEPYGNLTNLFNIDLNYVIKKEICDKLKYEFIYCNPYAGFQTLSDESNESNRTLNDPAGYCLAWCMLYLKIKLKYKYDCYKTISLIKNYVLNKFKNDFNINDSSNIYMIFVRYYAKYLDKQKNKIIKKCGINKDIIYHENLDNNNLKKIIDYVNKKIEKNI